MKAETDGLMPNAECYLDNDLMTIRLNANLAQEKFNSAKRVEENRRQVLLDD